MIEVKTDGKVATLPAKNKNKNIEPPESPSPVLRKELNVRAKKAKHGDRAANKGDGSLVLIGPPTKLPTSSPQAMLFLSPKHTPLSGPTRRHHNHPKPFPSTSHQRPNPMIPFL
ncbi:hypothetical protein LB505_013203 [Fusarium chuoi]|nr:hypothetical protein LB505_013203 [Fusarium chuoi]